MCVDNRAQRPDSPPRHQAHILRFPADLQAADVLAWIHQLAGTLTVGPRRLFGIPSIVFELEATAAGITHRLRVSHKVADYLTAELWTLLPGINITPDRQVARQGWDRVIELGQSHGGRTLLIHDVERFSAAVLGTFRALGPDESVAVQIVVSPAVPEKPPQVSEAVFFPRLTLGSILYRPRADKDELNDRRAKLAEPNMLAVIRIAARAASPSSTLHLVMRTYRALSSAGSKRTRFIVRRGVLQKQLQRRMLAATTPLLFPMTVTASELSALIAWPIGQPHVAGLARGHARQLPPIGTIPQTGRIIGRANFPGSQRPLAVSPGNLSRHLHIVGRTGTGKTTLMANLIVQDMNAGNGVVVVDPKPDRDNLFSKVLERVPDSRVGDVMLVDIRDTGYPVGFNILQGNPTVVAADLQALFDNLYPGDTAVTVPQHIFHVVMTLMTTTASKTPLTFPDMVPLCLPVGKQMELFSDQVIRGIRHNDELTEYWQSIDNRSRANRDIEFGALRRRAWQLNSHHEVRNIIGQSRSSFDMYEAIRSKKIILMHFGGLGLPVARILSSLFINALWSAVKGGAADPSDPTALYVDEFHEILNTSASPNDMFAQARSMGLRMTVAHQFMSQLERVRELQDGVEANTATKIALGPMQDKDARQLDRMFGPLVTDNDFRNQGLHDFIGLFATDEGVSSPVTGTTYDYGEPTGNAELVRDLNRGKYGRPVAEVEAEIQDRRLIEELRAAKPRLGSVEWKDT